MIKIKDKDVELIKNQAGKDKCPIGKMALYTNIDFNGGELGDILVIGPNVQLDEAELASYGFIVGGHDGVSCVVNNMSQAATLVAGLDLNGEILNIPSMTNIPSLVGRGWNDKTRSVVAAPVKLDELKMTSVTPITLKVKETIEIELKIENFSDISVPDTTLEVKSGNSDALSVGAFSQPGTIPAKGSTTVKVPVTGKKVAQTNLTFTLHTPVGYINQGENRYVVPARVEQFAVQLTMDSANPVNIGLNKTETVKITVKNLSAIDAPVASFQVEAGSEDIISVGAFTPPGNIPANDSVIIDVPVTGLKNGESLLTFTLNVPEEFNNTGDTRRVVNAKVQAIVKLGITMSRQIELVTGEPLILPVKITNESDEPVDALGVDFESGDLTLFTVEDLPGEVYVPPKDSVETKVKLVPTEDKIGRNRLTCSLTLPPGYTNEGESSKASIVSVTAERSLEVLQVFQSRWAEEGGYKYSYMLTMRSASVRVTSWELSFELPEGAKVSDTWYDTQKNWLDKRETGEMVYLTNKGGHTIDPGTNLPLQIQLVYPHQSPVYEYIYSLSLRQLR